MWVVWNTETGWSDESMRFATKAEAKEYVNSRVMPWNFEIREEA